jgi:hypothetical protein
MTGMYDTIYKVVTHVKAEGLLLDRHQHCPFVAACMYPVAVIPCHTKRP